MRIFVSEFLCSGAWPAKLDGSLLREGRAMLSAFLDDAGRISGIDVVTTWDTRLGPPPPLAAEFHLVESVDEERRLFEQLVVECDATCLIAPEFDAHLTRRAQCVTSQNRPLCGPDVFAINLCADKLQLAGHLQKVNVATIETFPFDPQSGVDVAPGFPCVVKPRYGAGSQETRLIADAAALASVIDEIGPDSLLYGGIVQPFIPGIAVSLAVIVGKCGTCRHCFPPAIQRLTDDGRFSYLGGQVPARNVPSSLLERLAIDACNAVPGLQGYVGLDLIVPTAAPEKAVVVEINPRLTTSYLGYRRLTDENLAERILFPDNFPDPIGWRSEVISFSADGRFSTTE